MRSAGSGQSSLASALASAGPSCAAGRCSMLLTNAWTDGRPTSPGAGMAWPASRAPAPWAKSLSFSANLSCGIAATKRRARSCVVRVSCSSRRFTPAEITPLRALKGSSGKPPARSTAVCLPRQITCPVLTRVICKAAAILTSEYTPQKRDCRSLISPVIKVSQPVAANTACSRAGSVAPGARLASMRCKGSRMMPVGARWA